MGRVYYVGFENVSVTAAQDLFEIRPASNKPCKLLWVNVSQSSDVDTEQLRFTIKRLPATVTSGTGGSTPTPTPLLASDAAAGATTECNNTGRATTNSTAVLLVAEGQNILSGWQWLPIPDAQPYAVNGEAFIIGLETAPADALSMNGYAVFEELG